MTVGVLIHQPDQTLETVISKMFRCSPLLALHRVLRRAIGRGPVPGSARCTFQAGLRRTAATPAPAAPARWDRIHGQDQGWDDDTCWLFEKPPDNSAEAAESTRPAADST
jgi:hypothetical protein